MARTGKLGPGMLVAAAFIGPGTVTTATVAGASFGLALLWALAFSVVATIVLQEMAARFGIVTRRGLGEALRTTFHHPVPGGALAALVIAAIGIGNCAYQAGNITGAAMGLESLSGVPRGFWSVAVGVAAFALLTSGQYRLLERVLMLLVAAMAFVFVTTSVLTRPNLSQMLSGLLVPSLPEGSLTMVVALIGTTVVPYNLFLHATAVREKWPVDVPLPRAISSVRWDGAIAILLGGVVTLAILSTASVFYAAGTRIDGAARMAEQLRPLLGAAARYFFAAGLFAAGLTSAITAPLAAAYATAGALGWNGELGSLRMRVVSGTIVALGTVAAVWGRNPVGAIVFAQAANGLLLPIVAGFLLLAMNRRDLLGAYVNGWWSNVLGGAVVLVVGGLGVFRLATAFG